MRDRVFQVGNPYFYASLTISEPHYNKMRANNSLTKIINYFSRHTLFFCLLPCINVRLGHITQSNEFHVGRRNTLTTGQFIITYQHPPISEALLWMSQHAHSWTTQLSM